MISDRGIPRAKAWYRRSITRKQQQPGEPQTHQFTTPPIHQAAHYKPSAPYVPNPHYRTPDTNFPIQTPVNTKAGYPHDPYPGTSKETKVDPELEKGDSSDQDTDIETEMERLREEIATLSRGKKAKHMKTDIQ